MNKNKLQAKFFTATIILIAALVVSTQFMLPVEAVTCYKLKKKYVVILNTKFGTYNYAMYIRSRVSKNEYASDLTDDSGVSYNTGSVNKSCNKFATFLPVTVEGKLLEYACTGNIRNDRSITGFCVLVFDASKGPVDSGGFTAYRANSANLQELKNIKTTFEANPIK